MESGSLNSPTDYCILAVDGPDAGTIYPLERKLVSGAIPTLTSLSRIPVLHGGNAFLCGRTTCAATFYNRSRLVPTGIRKR